MLTRDKNEVYSFFRSKVINQKVGHVTLDTPPKAAWPGLVEKCDRRRVHRQSDRHTQTHDNQFAYLSPCYGIAMGQIMTSDSRGTYMCSIKGALVQVLCFLYMPSSY